MKHPQGEVILKTLKKKFTKKNPDYVEAVKWGRWAGNIPPHVFTYHVLGDELKIARGGVAKVVEHFELYKVQVEWVDYTQVCAPSKIFTKQRFTLREDQKLLVKSVLDQFKKMIVPQGIIIAPTSFGKSFSLIFLANEIEQPTLILVHTTFLQKQWIDELSANFYVEKSKIGGAGGVFKKPRVGKINVALYHSMSKREINILFRDKVGTLIIDEGQKASVRQFQEAIHPFRSRFRISATANVERKDGKTFVVKDTVGDIIYTAEEGESNSKIFAEIFSTRSGWNPHRDIDWDKEDANGKKLHDGYTTYITEAGRNLDRNILIAKSAVRAIKQKKIVIIFVERKEQAAVIAKILSKFEVHLLIGKVPAAEIAAMDIPEKAKTALKDNSDPEKALDVAKDLALQRKLDCIIATQKGEVGLSIETLDHAIVTTPIGNNLERFNQLKGRVERKHKDARLTIFGEKNTPSLEVIVDDWDNSFNSWSNIKNQYKEFVIKNPYKNK
jgi:superfamily II DNA or RNA helicase